MLDPQASADALAARYYNEVLFDIEQNLKLGVGSEDVLREEHEHREKILEQAAAEGLGIKTDKNGKPLNVGHSRPSGTAQSTKGGEVLRIVDKHGSVRFAGTGSPVGNGHRGQTVGICLVVDTVQITLDDALLRTPRARHDRTKEFGALAQPNGRPRKARDCGT